MTSGGGLAVFDQWSNSKPLVSGGPSWIDGADRERINAYSLYEQIYWTIPEAFKLLQRGNDEDPIYIPAGRQIVDTVHRYLAPALNIVPDQNFGTPAEQALALEVITNLVRRERFYSRFSTAKREGIFRGDWFMHLYADPARPEGSRISIFFVDPAAVFPIYNEENVDEVIGYHLAEYIEMESGDPRIRRLTYRKATKQGGPSPITVEEGLFKLDEWSQPEANPDQVLRTVSQLPPEITQLPIYHIQNSQMTGAVWGNSELRGLERLLAAINQGITDEELTLALEGLGCYVTDAGTPVDETTGQPTAWNLGPARVVEIPPDTKFERVTGVASVSPFQEHLDYLHKQLDGTAAIPAVAKGSVNVDVAESGIALVLELGPLLAHVGEKELIVTDVLTNMLYDLKGWLIAYEGINLGEAALIPTYGDKIPVNRKQKFDELMSLFDKGLASGEYTRTELRKIGYDLPDETKMQQQILQETQDKARITADAMGARLDEELQTQAAAATELGDDA